MTPTTQIDKCIAIVYLPLAVSALADCVAEIGQIRTRKRIREHTNASMTSTASGRIPTTEADFLRAILVREGLVDDETLLAIRRQFHAKRE